MQAFLVIRSEVGLEPLHSDPVALLNLLHKIVGFGEQEVGIERKYAKPRLHPGGDVNERYTLRSEA
jgi:hypothetical protein